MLYQTRRSWSSNEPRIQRSRVRSQSSTLTFYNSTETSSLSWDAKGGERPTPCTINWVQKSLWGAQEASVHRGIYYIPMQKFNYFVSSLVERTKLYLILSSNNFILSFFSVKGAVRDKMKSDKFLWALSAVIYA